MWPFVDGSPKEVTDSMLNEFIPLLVSNKEGRGDCSGNLPDSALQVVGEPNPFLRAPLPWCSIFLAFEENFYFSGITRDSVRRQIFQDNCQKRCGSSTSSSGGQCLLTRRGGWQTVQDTVGTMSIKFCTGLRESVSLPLIWQPLLHRF